MIKLKFMEQFGAQMITSICFQIILSNKYFGTKDFVFICKVPLAGYSKSARTHNKWNSKYKKRK
jgi:hypothetical protein